MQGVHNEFLVRRRSLISQQTNLLCSNNSSKNSNMCSVGKYSKCNYYSMGASCSYPFCFDSLCAPDCTVCGVPTAVMNGPCHIHMALQMLHVQAPIYPPFSDSLACCCVSSLLDIPYNFVNLSLSGLLVLVEVGPP